MYAYSISWLELNEKTDTLDYCQLNVKPQRPVILAITATTWQLLVFLSQQES